MSTHIKEYLQLLYTILVQTSAHDADVKSAVRISASSPFAVCGSAKGHRSPSSRRRVLLQPNWGWSTRVMSEDCGPKIGGKHSTRTSHVSCDSIYLFLIGSMDYERTCGHQTVDVRKAR